jgi:hypothetical protein
MVWAFERALRVAAVDAELLGHLLAATVWYSLPSTSARVHEPSWMATSDVPSQIPRGASSTCRCSHDGPEGRSNRRPLRLTGSGGGPAWLRRWTRGPLGSSSSRGRPDSGHRGSALRRTRARSLILRAVDVQLVLAGSLWVTSSYTANAVQTESAEQEHDHENDDQYPPPDRHENPFFRRRSSSTRTATSPPVNRCLAIGALVWGRTCSSPQPRRRRAPCGRTWLTMGAGFPTRRTR